MPDRSLRSVATSRAGRHRRLLLSAERRLRPGLLDRVPTAWLGARVRPSRRSVLGVLGVGLALFAVFGVRLAMAADSSRPVPVAPSGPVGTPSDPPARPVAAPGVEPDPSSTPDWPTSPGPTTAAQTLVVQVAGRVRSPGVKRLGEGARVYDAIRAAGGARPGSDLVSINLAAPLADGAQVFVGRTGRSRVSVGAAAGSGQLGPQSGASSGGGASAALVDLNTADLAALDGLPGVGPVLAQRILDWRTAHGRFTSIDELDEVSGIGEKLLAEVRPRVRL